jgi:hypothetical protein
MGQATSRLVSVMQGLVSHMGIAHNGVVGYGYYMTGTDTIAQTDSRSRVVLPGHPNQLFLVRENSDGSVLLQPAHVVNDAQAQYDNTPELQDLLTRAAESPTVRRSRSRRV